uniref:Serine-threonine/tyrosine-protein kinase catalytic domain-containing protein n=1 Tax=Physcomitrium patens TaxID=3218 RepID=A0A2K1KVZ8_PHYPA|nr:hypothetical protein PHYPA_004966 [Physcomitrium patens]
MNLNEINKLTNLIEKSYLNEKEVHDVLKLIKIALPCIQHACEKQPTMAWIASLLQANEQSKVVVPY